MSLGTFNSYVNFVEWDETTSGPKHSTGQNSWRHLDCLISNSVQTINDIMSNDDSSSSSREDYVGCPRFSGQQPLTLVGFSKGCVVLNQLINDLTDSPSNVNESCRGRVDAMYWLDGGECPYS